MSLLLNAIARKCQAFIVELVAHVTVRFAVPTQLPYTITLELAVISNDQANLANAKAGSTKDSKSQTEDRVVPVLPFC